MSETLTSLDENLWIARRPLKLVVGDVGARMTVIRLPDGALLVHSPVALDTPTRAALDALGPVRWVLGPCKVHHFYLPDFAAAYPDAALLAAPGLEAKRRDVKFAHVLNDDLELPFGGAVEHHVFAGSPMMNEVVLLHRPTRTLVLTDLAFNLPPGARNEARLFHRLVGATGRFGPHRVVRLGIRDRAAAARSLERVLGWDFDRVIVSHGEVLETGGKAAMRDAFAFLGTARG
ncbi:MAG: DUF4336 domain-containing protein [Candidatus Binatia bacterium]